MTSHQALEIFLEKERELYKYKIGSITLWNLYRTTYRYRFVSSTTGVSSITNRSSRWKIMRSMIMGGYKSVKCLYDIFRYNRTYDNLVISFGRLQSIGDVYFDKFSDPVIDASDLKNSICIFQQPNANVDINLRRHKESVIPLDFLYLLTYLLIPIYCLWHIFSGNSYKIYKLYCKTQSIFQLSLKDLLYMNEKYMSLKIRSFFYYVILDRIKIKRIFGAGRRSYMDVTYAAHQLGIPVFEFQHGVTFGDTEYYSGPQCISIDPDFFLAFGDLWNGNQFGIASKKIINIGWAYKSECTIPGKEIVTNSVLLISSPEITHKILKTAIDLTIEYPHYKFFIRCHPYEKYSNEQMEIVNRTSNLFLDDNSIDSFVALCQYQYVVGENSSVVYEALSIGKPVGRLCYNGLNSTRFSNVADDGFVYLYKNEDFMKLVNSTTNCADNKAYSDFKTERFNNLLKS